MNQKKKIGLCVGIPVGVIALALAAYFLFYPLIMIGQGNYAVYVNMYGITEYEIDGTETLPPRAFYGCESLERVTLNGYINGDNFEGMEFYACTNLSSVTFGEDAHMDVVSQRMFTGCRWLQSVELPNTVRQIRIGAFDGCERLLRLRIPKTVKQIDTDAFNDCPLLEISYLGTVEEWKNIKIAPDWLGSTKTGMDQWGDIYLADESTTKELVVWCTDGRLVYNQGQK